MKRKTWIKIGAILGISAIVLLTTLIAHIYLVTKNKPLDQRNRQLARIDFQEDLDFKQALSVKNYVLTLRGVEGAHFNLDDRTFVYLYDPEEQHSDLVYKAVISKFNIKAKKFKVDEKLAANGCPIIDKSSISYKFTALVQDIIK